MKEALDLIDFYRETDAFMEQELAAPKLGDLKNIPIPYIIKDKVLMSPGTWNNFNYNWNEIKKAFDTSDWSDKHVRSLFLDHHDDITSDWVGFVDNERVDGEYVKGDLVIIDENAARKLAAGAKFGISPKVYGEASDGSMQNFTFQNFSIVITPAVKTAWINNKQNDKEGCIMPKKLEEKKLEDEKEEPEEEDEELKCKKYPKVEAREQEKDEEPEEPKDKKKKYPEPEEMKESVDEILGELSTEELSKWTDFIKAARAKDPKISFNEIAKRFKNMQQMSEQLSILMDLDTNFIKTLSEKISNLKEVKEVKEDKVEVTMAKKDETVVADKLNVKEAAQELTAPKDLDAEMNKIFELNMDGGRSKC